VLGPMASLESLGQVCAGKAMDTSQEESLKIVSYNILMHHSYGWDESWEAKIEDYPWAGRLAKLQEEFEQMQADVFCLQEVTTPMLHDLQPWFQDQGFRLVYLMPKFLPEWENGKGQSQEASVPGMATFVRAEKADVLDYRACYARDFLTETELRAEDANKISEKINCRADGVLCARLRLRSSSTELVIGNAHPTWWYTDDRECPISGKVVQIMLIARAFGEYAVGHNVPVEHAILCGDFNSLSGPGMSSSSYSDTGGYELITHGSLPAHHPESPQSHGWQLPALSLPFSMRSALAVFRREEPKGTYDYIFIGDAWHVVAVDDTPDDSSGFPNAQHPSDHFPICTQLAWRAVS